MPLGTVGILISSVYVCFGVLLFAVLVTGLVVLLRINALLKKRAALPLGQGQHSSEQGQPEVAERVLSAQTDR